MHYRQLKGPGEAALEGATLPPDEKLLSRRRYCLVVLIAAVDPCESSVILVHERLPVRARNRRAVGADWHGERAILRRLCPRAGRISAQCCRGAAPPVYRHGRLASRAGWLVQAPGLRSRWRRAILRRTPAFCGQPGGVSPARQGSLRRAAAVSVATAADGAHPDFRRGPADGELRRCLRR